MVDIPAEREKFCSQLSVEDEEFVKDAWSFFDIDGSGQLEP